MQVLREHPPPSMLFMALRSPIVLTSPPRSRTRPAPVTTTTRTFGSACPYSSACWHAFMHRPPNALKRSGRFSLKVATPASSQVKRISGSSFVIAGGLPKTIDGVRMRAQNSTLWITFSLQNFTAMRAPLPA